jgi:acetate kinase
MNLDQVDALLNKRSGMLGLTGVIGFRDLSELIADGSEAAELGRPRSVRLTP